MRRRVNITIEAGWLPTDTIHVYHGDENAADLASSGSVVQVAKVRVGSAAAGSVLPIDFDYVASDKCAALQIGVSVKDEAGNESAKLEAILQIEDPPLPPGRPNVAATANPGEAQLTWLASPDLPAP